MYFGIVYKVIEFQGSKTIEKTQFKFFGPGPYRPPPRRGKGNMIISGGKVICMKGEEKWQEKGKNK